MFMAKNECTWIFDPGTGTYLILCVLAQLSLFSWHLQHTIFWQIQELRVLNL
jgi:hypothetical protein